MGLLSNLPWVPALPIGGNRSTRTRRAEAGAPGAATAAAGAATSSPGRGRRAAAVRRAPAPLPQPPVSTADMARDQAELDGLLDKISESGMDGLSADEKRRLNELSKRMRGRR